MTEGAKEKSPAEPEDRREREAAEERGRRSLPVRQRRMDGQTELRLEGWKTETARRNGREIKIEIVIEIEKPSEARNATTGVGS